MVIHMGIGRPYSLRVATLQIFSAGTTRKSTIFIRGSLDSYGVPVSGCHSQVVLGLASLYDGVGAVEKASGGSILGTWTTEWICFQKATFTDQRDIVIILSTPRSISVQFPYYYSCRYCMFIDEHRKAKKKNPLPPTISLLVYDPTPVLSHYRLSQLYHFHQDGI